MCEPDGLRSPGCDPGKRKCMRQLHLTIGNIYCMWSSACNHLARILADVQLSNHLKRCVAYAFDYLMFEISVPEPIGQLQAKPMNYNL